MELSLKAKKIRKGKYLRDEVFVLAEMVSVSKPFYEPFVGSPSAFRKWVYIFPNPEAKQASKQTKGGQK